jgi:hypothetical protein
LLPTEAERHLRDGMRRGDDQRRQAIVLEAEQTLVEGSVEPDPVAEGSSRTGPETHESPMHAGARIVVCRRVTADGRAREVEERFEIVEQLSSHHNISGDVFRATRCWDGELYGDVVLKTPKRRMGRHSRVSTAAREELAREARHLVRFKDHPGILSPSGRPFVLDSETVIQMEYLPWGLIDYLRCHADERWLTEALIGLAAQCLDAVAGLGETRDSEGPRGYVHVDLKSPHLRLNYAEREDGAREWAVSLIDLDSIVAAGPIRVPGAKYNRGCVDPEKFMALHDPSLFLTADVSEMIYSLGLTFLSALADVVEADLEPRRFAPVGFVSRGGRPALRDEPHLRQEIERVRALDQHHLLAVRELNAARRRAGGSPTVAPRFFAGLEECLKPRSERQDARTLQGRFAGLIT